MNTSILTNNAHQIDPGADLDAKLKFFEQPPIQVNVRPNALTNPNPNVTEEQADVNPEAEISPDTAATDTAQTEAVDEGEAGEGDGDEQVTPEFAAAFEQYFGLKPDEAMQTVNQLVAFRDEMTLMRQWGVSPVEYDTRMTAVREFYQGLPDDGKEQFNTIEGAMTIWEHLQKNGQAPSTTTKNTSRSTKQASRIKQASTPKAEFIKKSEILKMDAATYQANLPRITKAFREGRVLQDT